MFCRLTRWSISKAEDRKQALPRWAERHAARCASCRAYARFIAGLPSRFSEETPALLAKAPDMELDLAGPASATALFGRRDSRRRPALLRPFPAAAAALAVVAVVFVLTQVVRRETPLTPADRDAVFAALRSVTAAPDGLGGAVAQAESPLDRERQVLESSLRSAVAFLETRLDIRIERKNTPKSL